MATPLLETKLYTPTPRRALVPRRRLIDRLSGGIETRLTLVSAPAGFGKTTLVAEWLARARADGRLTAWLSLDHGDDQTTSFWRYVIAALRTGAPDVGAGALTLVEDSQPPPIEVILATLLNDLSALPNDIVLVLDDYHVIDAREVHEGMTFLLDHLPPGVHVVIATRADPPLPLARWRVRGELCEVRAADLRFTSDEAAAYLSDVMGLHLAEGDIAALEGRTEGWIAALQLAALSMQGRTDTEGFIAGFAGDDRYVVDYLVEEVLQRQSSEVRSFLVQTSILSRLNGPLSDAVTGQSGARAMLEALERRNLFLVPLDDRRQWYRYHHLFSDVLQAHALDEQPGRIPDLHRRASEWYDQNGEPAEAIRHALAGRHFERAAALIERALPALRQAKQAATIRRWLEAIPDELFRVRPVLSVAYVGALMVDGEFRDVDAYLGYAERWLDAPPPEPDGSEASSTAVVVDEDALRRLPSAIAMYRAAQARILGDVAGTMAHARRAFDLAGEDDHLGRGGAAGFLALASWTRGDLDAAHRFWTEAIADLQQAGHITDVLGCTRGLADIRIAQGRLGEAMRTYERGLQLATQQGGSVLRGAGDMHVGMSELYLEWGDLDAATRHLLTCKELGEQAALAQNAYRWRVAMAGIREAQGDLDGALDLLNEAEQVYVSEYFPDVRPIAALKARLWIAEEKLGDALDWVSEHGLSADDDPSYLREFEHITLARLLVAPARDDGDKRGIQTSLDLLERLLGAAEDGKRTRSVIEIHVLEALAHQILGDVAAALVPLRRALDLAAPEGFVRTFVAEGPPMAALLQAAGAHGIVPAFVRELPAAFDHRQSSTRVRQGVVEPLSQRELDVLRLLATDLSGPAIARELVVSLSTIRSHTKNIYAKLGVNSRRAAVRRAEELDLLARSRTPRR